MVHDVDSYIAGLEQALVDREIQAIADVFPPNQCLNRVFPEPFSDPRYQRLLRELKLDPESIAKIRIPDLSFLKERGEG